MPCRERRHRRRAQGGRDGELRQQQRIAGLHVGQHAERRDGEQSGGGVLGMTVDVFEGIQSPVAGGHQFDDADSGMACKPGGFLEFAPTAVILLDLVRQSLDERARADPSDEPQNVADADIVDHGLNSLKARVGSLYDRHRQGQQEDSKLHKLRCRLRISLGNSGIMHNVSAEALKMDGQVWRPGGASSMDDLDRKLIALLRENARMPAASLAKSLKVARGTVQNRLAKLERDGIIAGYTIRLKPKIDEQGIVALMTIAVEGNRIEPVLRTLRGDPAIVTLYTTNGRWDLVAEIRADTLQSFDQVLGRIRRVEGISGTETSLLLSTHKL